MADNYTQEEKDNGKVMAILSYIGILVLIPILTGDVKKSGWVRFHATQGVNLCIAGILCSILSWVPILNIILGIVGLAILILSILGIINVVKGEAKELPLVGQFDLLSKIM